MLKIKNNNIYMNRGENVAPAFKIWKPDGTPFILPSVIRDNEVLPLQAFCVSSTTLDYYEYTFFNPFYGDSIVIDLYDYGEVIINNEFGEAGEAILYEGILKKIVSTVPIKCIRHGSITLEPRIDAGLTSCIALTVRAGMYDDIVLCKTLNSFSCITKNGKTDYTFGGLNRFDYDIINVPTNNVSDVLTALRQQPNKIACQNGAYYILAITGSSGATPVYDLMPYEFSVTVPIDYKDTSNLEAKVYTYDVIAYQGIAGNKLYETDDTVDFKDIVWKKELVDPHMFIIGDSNNA